MYATVGFLCIDIGELWGTPNKQELQNEKFLLTVEFDPGTSCLLERRVIQIAPWSH